MNNNTDLRIWGFHLLLDCAGCNIARITDPNWLDAWVRDLVIRIGMIRYGDPVIQHFGHNEEHLEGYTVIQLIETSNIIAHFNDHTGEGYIDIFSCKPFEINDAVEQVKTWVEPKTVRVNYLTRQA